jgi:adenine-specific DNA-methyltransferase
MSQFNNNSIKLNELLPKTVRQSNGIYFTPSNIRKRLFDILDSLNIRPKTILEPSFGSGEFIQDCIDKYGDIDIYGTENNKDIFESTYPLFKNNNLTNQDFLEYKSEEVDLIIGNPPYFQTSIKNKKCMSGRGNIFVLFIYKCITEHLKNGGILAFVLPTSFYNSSFYEPCRKYIYHNCSILHCENIENSSYYDTNQDTMILILKKCISNDKKFFLNFNNSYYISPNFNKINELLQNTKTLNELGFNVKTGEVVWNQHKDKLSNDNGTLVIYTSNIVNNNLVINNLNGEKKQYIKDFNGSPIKGPAFLVSRGYGNKYKFNYLFIDDDELEFYGENHINVIYPLNDDAKQYINIIKKSLDNPKTLEFISMFIGNGALSKTELQYLFPIFIE